MESSPIGVLIMAYGSALGIKEEAIHNYLRHILQYYRKTDPDDVDVQDLRARYQAIGGSPLYEITERIAQGVQDALDLSFPRQFKVYTAMKHSPPFIKDTVIEMRRNGIDKTIAVALAPFRSRLSTEGYYHLVVKAGKVMTPSMQCFPLEDWNLHPLFLMLWKNRINDALRLIGSEPAVIFTNHSLPQHIQQWNDAYPEQFKMTAKVLSQECNLSHWTIAYQSAGGGSQTWLGPHLAEVIQGWKNKGFSEFLLAPIGFLMDHLEILYDLDVEAQSMAKTLNVKVDRTTMPNDDPLFLAMLVDLIREKCSTKSM